MLAIPSLVWVRWGAWDHHAAPWTPQRWGGHSSPLSHALGDRDTGLSPVTPKRISLAGAVGGCGRAPPPTGAVCRWAEPPRLWL